ncbi:DUF742 domain-containing protein [Nocardia sp. NPDC052112]|uniref:DUF742 domain-containing protein n=1 Tax=Nocardia sp. NPDC052112 TaxID=3155646 RepID=UPI00341D63F6
MTRPGRDEDPDRLYTVTGGRSKPATDDFDLVTLVVSECDPAQGMQPEHTKILLMCRAPTAVVEIAAELRVPVGVATILLSDLLLTGKITVRHPQFGTTSHGASWNTRPTLSTLEKVLGGLRSL